MIHRTGIDSPKKGEGGKKEKKHDDECMISSFFRFFYALLKPHIPT